MFRALEDYDAIVKVLNEEIEAQTPPAVSLAGQASYIDVVFSFEFHVRLHQLTDQNIFFLFSLNEIVGFKRILVMSARGS